MSIYINKIKYEIKKKLGQGGYGKVYQVLNKSNNKYYALKEFPIKGETKDNIQAIKKEAQILSKFNHKNIVKYYDSLEKDDKFYILMEYCDDQNLNVFMEKHKEKNELIEEKIIYNIIKQICLGLKEIHSKKIIHRDLKPENIFMNKNNEIKIGDFGISKELNSYKTFTKTNKKLGSLYYTAPEILSDGKYNIKADIWSLGCIIYELFNLDFYFLNNMMHEVKQIDENIYNSKWQKLIDSLLETKYDIRPDINCVIDIIECKDLKKLDKDAKIIEDVDNKLKKLNLKDEEKKINEKNNQDNNNNIINKNNNNIINNQNLNMMNPTYINPLLRLREEYSLCTQDNDLIQLGCSFGLENNNIYRWNIIMIGPKNTPYERGLFTISAIFPEDYPIHEPEFKFRNKIYHLKVDFINDIGHISLCGLEQWRLTGKVKDFPYYTVKQALFDIFCLFYYQFNEDEFVDESLASQKRVFNPEKFNEEARKWTQQYASVL